jgi:methyltransferase family protein
VREESVAATSIRTAKPRPLNKLLRACVPLPVRDRVRELRDIVRRHAVVSYLDRLPVDELRMQYPELAHERLVPVDVVDDAEQLAAFTDGGQDFIIANHFIEDCEDPLRTLQNMLRKIRPRVVIYMAVPDKRYTFDGATKAGWNTTYATTSDWRTFRKSNTVILGQGTSYDSASAFRGAVSRFGDTYYLPYDQAHVVKYSNR